jgi:RES domain-containing protein
MPIDLNADLLQAIDDLGRKDWSGIAYRHTSLRREPLSGSGASASGGRWNPRSVATIYLAFPVTACLAEFMRMAESQPGGVEAFQSRDLHEIDVKSLSVLDLTATKAREAVGIDIADIEGDDWTQCQDIGRHAQYLGVQAILALSATRVGSVLAAYERNVQRGQLTLVRTKRLSALL